MRVLYNPIDMVKKLFSGGGGGAAPAPTGPSAAELREQENAAREEAARRAEGEARQRQGAATSILSDPNLAGTFGSTTTKKKSLFGG